MRTIKSIATLGELVASQHAAGVTLYVRTSSGIANDRKMGCSLNHASGQREAGISVTELAPHAEVLEPGDHNTVSMQVGVWGYVAPITYILTGEVVGQGSDGEPVLDAVTWQAVAKVDAAAIKAEREAMCQHANIERGTYIGLDGATYRYCRCGARVAA